MTYQHIGSVVLYRCDTCGAAVVDAESHTRYHEEMLEVTRRLANLIWNPRLDHWPAQSTGRQEIHDPYDDPEGTS